MNILEQEDIIKGMPDASLQQEMSVPSGQVPQFLVLSEIQRRTDMRDRFEASEPQPTTTVRDQIMAEGLGASVPQPNMPPMAPPNMPPMPPPNMGGMLPNSPVPARPNSSSPSLPVGDAPQGLAGMGVQMNSGGVVRMQQAGRFPTGQSGGTSNAVAAVNAAIEQLRAAGRDTSIYSQYELRKMGEEILGTDKLPSLVSQGYRAQQPGDTYTPQSMDYGLLSYDPEHPSNVALDSLETPFTVSGAQAEARDIEAEQRANLGAQADAAGKRYEKFIREDEQLGTLGGVVRGGYGLMKNAVGSGLDYVGDKYESASDAYNSSFMKTPVTELWEQYFGSDLDEDLSEEDPLPEQRQTEEEQNAATFSDAEGNTYPIASLNDPTFDNLANRLGVSSDDMVLAGSGTINDEYVEILPRDNADLNTNPTVIRDVSRADPQRDPRNEMIVTPNYEEDDALNLFRAETANLLGAEKEESEGLLELIEKTRAEAKKRAFNLGIAALGAGIASGDMSSGIKDAVNVASETISRGEGVAAPLEAAMVTRKTQGIKDRIDAIGALANADYRFKSLVAQANRDQVMTRGDQVSLVGRLIPLVENAMVLSEHPPGSDEYNAEIAQTLSSILAIQGISHLVDPDLLSGSGVSRSQNQPTQLRRNSDGTMTFVAEQP